MELFEKGCIRPNQVDVLEAIWHIYQEKKRCDAKMEQKGDRAEGVFGRKAGKLMGMLREMEKKKVY